MQSAGVPELDDETRTVWYAATHDIPEPVFQEAVRLIIQGELKPEEYTSGPERSIPALIRRYHRESKEKRARMARLEAQFKDRLEMETTERPTLEQVKAFNQRLKGD